MKPYKVENDPTMAAEELVPGTVTILHYLREILKAIVHVSQQISAIEKEKGE